MTMYVRVLEPITVSFGNDDGSEFHLDQRTVFKILPLWVAQLPGFGELWAGEKVEVATDTGFTSIITSIPATELSPQQPQDADLTAIAALSTTTYGRSLLAQADSATARATLGLPYLIDVADAAYGVTPSSTNPEVAIQSAITYAAANSIPEVVVSRPGIYIVDLHTVPGQSFYAAAIYAVSSVRLILKTGVVIKLKNNATLPVGATAAHIIGGDTATLKSGWSVEGGGTIDGNATNQTAPTILAGMALVACRSSYVKDILVKSVYGTSSSGSGETLHFEATKCRDVRFIGCEADGTVASTNTATGFSANFSFGVSWNDCVSHSMGHGMGFTAWMCGSLRYADCNAYSNGASGFNCERSNDIEYVGCISGGQTPFIELGGQNPYFPSGQTALGNAVGVSIQGCTDVRGDFVSTHNGINLAIYTSNPGSGLTALVNTRVVITGDCRGATTAEVSVEKASTGGTDQVEVKVDVLSGGASVADSFYSYAKAPLINYDTGSSGVRYSFLGTTGAFVARWISAKVVGPISGGSVMGLTPDGQLVTAGRKINRRAVAANTTITLQDEYIGVTDTTAARTITLLAASTAGSGAVYSVKDESGAAATNNITLARAGSDLIEGATSKVINTNYGSAKLMSTGTAWVVLP